MRTVFILFVSFLLLGGCVLRKALSVGNLRCEYMQNPLGMDVPQPRFSWELTSAGKDRRQTARQILVSEDPAALAKGDMWDSGKISGNETNQIHYDGRPLKPFTYYYWRVRVWDEQGKPSAWSAAAKFSTGALSASDWTAQWIGDADVPSVTSGVDSTGIPPSPLLRKEINIDRKIKHALYHTSALGIYEAYINGKKVGNQLRAPEWTDYDHHVQYQTYDVTGMLQKGANALGVMLAGGWYAGMRWPLVPYGSLTRKFFGQLVIYYEDGTSETVITDRSWKYLTQGPITQVTTYGGEEYDAKNEPKGWDRPGFDDSQWSVPAVYPGVSAGLCAQLNEPIAVISEHKPLSVRKVGEHKYIFDLGQNIVGWCRLTLPYNPGRTLTFRYGEVLNDDGTLYTENLRSARQTDIYHPGPERRIDYEPRFTYHGFRFVEVDGLTQAPRPGNILGKMIASSSPETGTFVTSDKDLNKLRMLIT